MNAPGVIGKWYFVLAAWNIDARDSVMIFFFFFFFFFFFLEGRGLLVSGTSLTKGLIQTDHDTKKSWGRKG